MKTEKIISRAFTSQLKIDAWRRVLGQSIARGDETLALNKLCVEINDLDDMHGIPDVVEGDADVTKHWVELQNIFLSLNASNRKRRNIITRLRSYLNNKFPHNLDQGCRIWYHGLDTENLPYGDLTLKIGGLQTSQGVTLETATFRGHAGIDFRPHSGRMKFVEGQTCSFGLYGENILLVRYFKNYGYQLFLYTSTMNMIAGIQSTYGFCLNVINSRKEWGGEDIVPLALRAYPKDDLNMGEIVLFAHTGDVLDKSLL